MCFVSSTECKDLLRCGMLNPDSESRHNITEVRLSPWMRGPVSPLTPYTHTKILVEDCLPQMLLPSWETYRSDYNTSRQQSLTPPLPPVAESPRHSQRADDQTMAPSVVTSMKESRRGKDSSHYSVRSKISSAGKKLVHSILQRPHSSRTNPVVLN